MPYNVIDKNNQINEGTFKTRKEAESFIDQLPGANRRYGIKLAKNKSKKDLKIKKA
jgi:hypothetical protein